MHCEVLDAEHVQELIADGGIVDIACQTPRHLPEVTAATRTYSQTDRACWVRSVTGVFLGYALISHPLSLAQTRQQCSRETVTVWQVLRQAHRVDGLRGLFRGCPASCLSSLFGDTLFYWMVEVLREKCPFHCQVSCDGSAGMVADLGVTPFYVPLSVVFTRQMTAGWGMASSVRPSSMTGTVRSVLSESGVRGLYSGLSLCMLSFPVTALWWALYGVSKRHVYTAVNHIPTPVMRRLPSCLASRTDNLAANVVSGAVTSSIVSFTTNPISVVRSRVQALQVPKTRFKAWFVAKDVILHEGMNGFVKGAWAATATGCLSGALFGAIYEATKCIAASK